VSLWLPFFDTSNLHNARRSPTKTILRGGGGIDATNDGWNARIITSFLLSQALPIGLLLAISIGLLFPAPGCAIGKLSITKYAPHAIFFAGGLMLK
jgi:hypothetical protein